MSTRTRLRVLVIVLLVSVATAACALKTTTGAYAWPGTSLRGLHGYSWGPSDSTPTGDPRFDGNEILADRVRAAVDRQLAARGFQRSEPGVAPLVVRYHASVEQRIDLSNRDAPSARESVESCPACKPFIYDAGTLVIDLVDARDGTVLWRGWSEGNMGGVAAEQRWLEERIEQDVTRIFRRLPR